MPQADNKAHKVMVDFAKAFVLALFTYWLVSPKATSAGSLPCPSGVRSHSGFCPVNRLGELVDVPTALGPVGHFFFPKTGEPFLSAFQSKKS
jgi:hypothetical protein